MEYIGLDRDLFRKYGYDNITIDTLISHIIKNSTDLDLVKEFKFKDDFDWFLREVFKCILLIDITDDRINDNDYGYCTHNEIIRRIFEDMDLGSYDSVVYDDLIHWFYLFQENPMAEFMTGDKLYMKYKQNQQFMYEKMIDNGIVEHIKDLQKELNELKAWKEKLKQRDDYANFFID